jgi:hypothetical protein
VAIWYIFSVLVCCAKKNLATLLENNSFPSGMNARERGIFSGMKYGFKCCGRKSRPGADKNFLFISRRRGLT